jgi:molybdopterin-guanine dinucleotide biosynthesis protein A
MGGVAKGMLLSSGVPIARRLRDAAASAVREVVLVGETDSYASLGLRSLADDRKGAGPLGGLVALLRYVGQGHAIALACDMPFVTPAILGRLVSERPDAVVLAPRTQSRWEPLFARYDASRSLLAATRLLESSGGSLQPLLNELGATALLLSEAEQHAMTDWDRPEDLP